MSLAFLLVARLYTAKQLQNGPHCCLCWSHFDKFKSVPYPYHILGPEHIPAKLCDLMLVWYYVWDMQKERSISHAYFRQYDCADSAWTCRGKIESRGWRSQFRVSKWLCFEAYTEMEIPLILGQLLEVKHPLCNIEQQHQDKNLRLFSSPAYSHISKRFYGVTSWQQSRR